MPLMHSRSKKAFKHNVEVEMKAHPDERAKDLAIAYSIKRRSPKKMAMGGMAAEEDREPHMSPMMSKRHEEDPAEDEYMSDDDQMLAEGGHVLTAEDRKHIAKKNFALPGGRYPIEDESHARNALSRVSEYGDEEEKEKVRSAVHRKYPGMEMEHKAHGGEIEEDEMPHSIADAVMAKRSKLKDKGMVDLSENAHESPLYHDFDEANEDALEYSQDDHMEDEPMDSIGDEHEKDEEDEDDAGIVSAIRKRMKMRGRR